MVIAPTTINLEAINLVKENGVIMFTLMLHTTHGMQPLNTAVLGLLKTHWQDACHEYLQMNPGKVITKYVFNEVFSKEWLKAISPERIISGFRVCGIYPFNPTAILSKYPESFSKKDASSNARGSCNSKHTDGENTETAISFIPE